jgi:alpha-tubulin suppressor-like RCC1 family protein
VDGGVRCWGANALGELGNGMAVSSVIFPMPVAVVGLSDATALSVGVSFSCALSRSGGVRCWGGNRYGQLGDGSTMSAAAPVASAVAVVNPTHLVTGTSHACAVADGMVRCWGGNAFGQLGEGTMTGRTAPALVALPAAVVSITAGGEHSCAATRGGPVFCWGQGFFGQLGDGSMSNRSSPVRSMF